MKWFLFMYSLPAKASRERVRLWRKLRDLGSVALKNTVYILPARDELYESFQWLQQEIQKIKGEAMLLKTDTIEGVKTQEIIELFNQTRNQDYDRIINQARALLKKIDKTAPTESHRYEEIKKELQRAEQDLWTVENIDFFGASLQAEAKRLLEGCKKRLKGVPKRIEKLVQLNKRDFLKRQWVTRKRPHVDRLASAWLIKRFIDPQARFVFVSGGEAVRGAVPFDMMGAELSHQGEDCTFETLLRAFGIQDRASWQLAEIVHDVDLRDNKYGRAEAQGLEVILRGLMALYADDQELLQAGLTLFEALYLALKRRS